MEKMLQELKNLAKEGCFKPVNGGNVNIKPVARYLGKLPDEQIASIVGVKVRKIRRFRTCRGVSEYVPPETAENVKAPILEEGKGMLDMAKKEERITKHPLQLTQLEMDILRLFLDVAEHVGNEKYRARKTTKEIQDAISDRYERLKWYHIRTALISLEKRKVLLRVNGIKKQEINPAMHPRVTYQLNTELLVNCEFVEIEKRISRKPTYKRRREIKESILEEKSFDDMERQAEIPINPAERISMLESELVGLKNQMELIDGALERIEQIRNALQKKRNAFADESELISKNINTAKVLIAQLEELFK